jgi:hypothetical protein
VDKAKERAFGAEKLKHLREENRLLMEQYNQNLRYLDEIEANRKKDLDAIKADGLDENGNRVAEKDLLDKFYDKFLGTGGGGGGRI